MRVLVTLLIIVAVIYGLYNFTMAAYGWFQMSNLVDEVARPEASKIGAQQQGSFGAFDSRDRFGRLQEQILKGAAEAGVALSPENIKINVADGMLDVRLAWNAPMVAFQGKTYLDLPMSLQRGFLIKNP